MKLTKVRKKALLLALCSILSLSAVQGYTYADSVGSSVSMSISSDSIKYLKFNAGVATINLTESFTSDGFLSINVSQDLVDYSSALSDPVILTYKYNGSYKTIRLTKSNASEKNSTSYRFYLGEKGTVSTGDITITDVNKGFTRNFKVSFSVTTNKDESLVPAYTVSDRNRNVLTSYLPNENKLVYSGYVFSNSDSKNSFFFKTDARTEFISLNIGSPSIQTGNKFIIEYFNNIDTYNDIQDKGAYTKDKKPRYRSDQYYITEVPVTTGYNVNLPWLDYSGFIKVSLRTPDILRLNLSVMPIYGRIDISNPYNPSVDQNIYNTGSNIQPGTTAINNENIKTGVSRVSGINRYMTSLQLSKDAFKTSDVAVVASGENFADALSGGALASAYNAPLLLVNKSFANRVNEELDRLGVKTVYVLGGQNSISSTVENTLSTNSRGERRTIKRLFGDNRFETSMAIYDELIKLPSVDLNPIFVNGNEFADALSAGPLAAKLKRAIVLTNGKNVSYRFDKSNSRNIVIGGYKSMDGSFLGDRIYGDNRFETAANIASRFYNPETVTLASGEEYPDGLSAISLYGKYKSPLLLTSKYNLPKQASKYIKDQKVKNVVIVGGEGSVSSSVENELR